MDRCRAAGVRLRTSARWFGGLALGVALLLAIPSAAGAPGALDVTFGVGGVVRTDLGGTYDWAYASAVLPDGRIVAAGVTNGRGTHDFVVARYTTTQQLDPTFADGGLAITDFDDSIDWGYAVAVQPDGKIVLGGVSAARGHKRFALVRYLPDGTLDADFGEGGRMVEQRRPLTSDVIRALAVQPDGRIVVAGESWDDAATISPQGDFIVARYLPDGSPDLTFGLAGIVTTDFDQGSYDQAKTLAVEDDGRIILAGSTNRRARDALYGADDLALARYTKRGLLDPGFGDDGKVMLDGARSTRRSTPLPSLPTGASSRPASSTASGAATSCWPASSRTGRSPPSGGRAIVAFPSTISARTPSG